MMGMNSIWHWLIVLLVIVLLFGAGRISGVMGDLGKGLKSFKKGLNDDDDAPAPGETPKPQARITEDRPADSGTTTTSSTPADRDRA